MPHTTSRLRSATRLLPLLVIAGMLAACATPQKRIQTALEDAGLSREFSRCMGESLTRNLSNQQLRELQRTVEEARNLKLATPREFGRFMQNKVDLKTMAILMDSSLGCFPAL